MSFGELEGVNSFDAPCTVHAMPFSCCLGVFGFRRRTTRVGVSSIFRLEVHSHHLFRLALLRQHQHKSNAWRQRRCGIAFATMEKGHHRNLLPTPSFELGVMLAIA